MAAAPMWRGTVRAQGGGMATAQIIRFTAAAAIGAAMGLVIAGVETLAATSVIGIVLARVIGWGWGWSAPLVVVGYLMARHWRRHEVARGRALTMLVVPTMASAAVSAHVLVGPALSWWGFGALLASPLLGLLAWWAASPTMGGVLARTLVPVAAIAEAVLLAPGASTGRVAWFELLACGVMLWGGVIAAIFTAGVGVHAGAMVQTPEVPGQPEVQARPVVQAQPVVLAGSSAATLAPSPAVDLRPVAPAALPAEPVEPLTTPLTDHHVRPRSHPRPDSPVHWSQTLWLGGRLAAPLARRTLES